MAKCVALLSGGLDSMLAIRLMQAQEIEIEALTFRTVFTCCHDQAARAAHQLQVPLTVVTPEDDYLQLIRRPQFGYGRGANPCIDCRIYMFQMARAVMQRLQADFVISGEIVGQRPKSQKRRDLEIIARHSGLEDRLLRPLCARRLAPTWPECKGLVQRERLHAFCGRSRKGLIRLAASLGITDIPAPSTGCQLTEPRFSRKVYDLLAHDSTNELWAFELLKVGRHYRWNVTTKLIVGRHEMDNRALEAGYWRCPGGLATLLQPRNFRGPFALISGPADEPALTAAGGLMLRHGRQPTEAPAQVDVHQQGRVWMRVVKPDPAAEALNNMTTIRTRC